MPLKPVLERAPLYPCAWTPLRPGQIHTEWKPALALYSAVRDCRSAAVAEGAVRLAFAVKEKPSEEPALRLVREVMAGQVEDGSLPCPAAEQLAWVRAAYAIAEAEADRGLLTAVLRWLGWCASQELPEDSSLRPETADLMELIESVYLLTGKSALLSLMSRLRADCASWMTALHTFTQQRPTSKLELSGDDQPLHNPVRLADGFRAAMLGGIYMGSGKHLSAGTVCWQKLARYHLSAAGGTTAAPDLEGASPAKPQSAASIGAWAEAFAMQSLHRENTWVWWELDRLMANALPAAIVSDPIHAAHRVNRVACAEDSSFAAEREADLARLARGVAALLASAVVMESDGVRVQHLLPGSYAVAGSQGSCVLRLSDKTDESCQIALRGVLEGALRIRIPARLEAFTAALEGGGAYLGDTRHHLTLRKEWRSGDSIRVTWDRAITTEEAYHQGQCVYWGAELMAMPADDESYAVAVTGAPHVAEGRVWLPVASTADWPMKEGQPSDTPVLPAVSGEAADVCLCPFASLTGRIAVFPTAGTRA